MDAQVATATTVETLLVAIGIRRGHLILLRHVNKRYWSLPTVSSNSLEQDLDQIAGLVGQWGENVALSDIEPLEELSDRHATPDNRPVRIYRLEITGSPPPKTKTFFLDYRQMRSKHFDLLSEQLIGELESRGLLRQK